MSDKPVRSSTIVTASFYRRDKCEVCNKTAERQVEFTGLSLADCQRQADRWGTRPLRHKKCEGPL